MGERGKSACCVNGLDCMFGESYASRELDSYKKEGLGERARLLIEYLCGQGLAGQAVLEVGCGIGALHLELLKAGAPGAVGVDASPACIQAATGLAREMGLAARAEHLIGDFIQVQAEVSPAEIVLLDRVVCCYPDMAALVDAAARHARAFCGLTYPRRGWWMRALFWGGNLWEALVRSPYRLYYHNPKRIAAILAAEGFREAYRTTTGPWEVAVFRRAQHPAESTASTLSVGP